MSDKNDMAYWYPILQRTGVPTPRTSLLHTDVELSHLLDGNAPDGWEGFLDNLQGLADAIGYPCFLRTGQTSNKHAWKDTCYVESAEVLPRHVGVLVEFSAMADFMGLTHRTWAVREFLHLESAFTAFNGFPVNREQRFFIDGGHVCCHHPYWPPGSIRNPSLPDWESRLVALNLITPAETAMLCDLSCQVSKYFPDAMSLDWAKTIDGKWIAIDMALAERSFHWPDCTVGWRRWPELMKECQPRKPRSDDDLGSLLVRESEGVTGDV